MSTLLKKIQLRNSTFIELVLNFFENIQKAFAFSLLYAILQFYRICVDDNQDDKVPVFFELFNNMPLYFIRAVTIKNLFHLGYYYSVGKYQENLESSVDKQQVDLEKNASNNCCLILAQAVKRKDGIPLKIYNKYIKGRRLFVDPLGNPIYSAVVALDGNTYDARALISYLTKKHPKKKSLVTLNKHLIVNLAANSLMDSLMQGQGKIEEDEFIKGDDNSQDNFLFSLGHNITCRVKSDLVPKLLAHSRCNVFSLLANCLYSLNLIRKLYLYLYPDSISTREMMETKFIVLLWRYNVLLSVGFILTLIIKDVLKEKLIEARINDHYPHIELTGKDRTQYPKQLRDPISHGMPTDPCIAEDGVTYSRQCLWEWFSSCDARGIPRSLPLSGKEVSNTPLIRNNLWVTKLLEKKNPMAELNQKVTITTLNQ